MSFTPTKAISKIRKLTNRRRVIQGGTWAGKTFAIMAVIINKAIKSSGLEVLVVAESIPALKGGAMKDFLLIMELLNRFHRAAWNKSDRKYTFTNGSTIKFDSFDSVGKAKASGKRTHLFINEANHIDFKIADTLMTRTSGVIWIDFNPDEEFWAHTELEDCDRIILTHEDNSQVPETIKADFAEKLNKAYFDPYGDHDDENNIKSKYWANWCTVYLRGQIGVLEGVIYRNWSKVSGVPENARLVGYGLDFGYSNDVTAGVAVWYGDNQHFLDEMFYETGMSNADIAASIKQYGADKVRGIADSAEPKSIAELRSRGLSIVGATKGKDSVNNGIDLVQEHDFFVTDRSLNLIDEFRKYRWDEDKTGKRLNQPIDRFNHLMDALRYWGSVNLKTKRRKGLRRVN